MNAVTISMAQQQKQLLRFDVAYQQTELALPANRTKFSINCLIIIINNNAKKIENCLEKFPTAVRFFEHI